LWGAQDLGTDGGVQLDSFLTKQSDGERLWKVVTGVGLLAAVLAFGYVHWHRRFRGRASEVKILSLTPVGQKEKIALVEVMGERLVLGVTSHQISLIYKKEGGGFQEIFEKAGEA
jgi:flagellar biogenesis protein FliO